MTRSGPDPTLIQLGVFGAAHGIRGEVRLKSYTADPSAIATYGPLTGSDGRTYELLSVRPQKDMLVARVRGIADRNAAERLVNIRLSAPRTVLGSTEDEDEFFHADLVGLAARQPDGTPLGRVVALHDFGGGTLIEVAGTTGPSTYYPFTKRVVPVVDIAAGHVVIDPPPETGGDLRETEQDAPAPVRKRSILDRASREPAPEPPGPARRRGKP